MSVHLPALTTAMVLELSALTLGVATSAGVDLAMLGMELTVKVGKFYQTIQYTSLGIQLYLPTYNVKYRVYANKTQDLISARKFAFQDFS